MKYNRRHDMKAALLNEAKAPIDHVDLPRPGLSPGGVVVRVEVCGLCHTDLHIADGDWKLPRLPLVLGHEIVGTVEEIGAGADGLQPGERVGIAWLHRACGSCDLCVQGQEMFCEAQENTGYTVDGGFAEFVAAPAAFAVKIPAELSSAAAAPLLCAGVTPYRALKQSGARAGQTVALWGVGGLGHLAVQLAKAMGLRTVAVDVSDEKLATAIRFGADAVVNARHEPAAKAIRKLGGAHAALNFVATRQTMEEAFYCLRRAGTLVVVGLPREEFTLPIIPLVGRGLRVVGSSVGTRQDVREVLALAAAGRVSPLVQERPLTQISEALADLRAGRIAGRCVLRVAEA